MSANVDAPAANGDPFTADRLPSGATASATTPLDRNKSLEMIYHEDQIVPRLGVTWRPNDDHMVRLVFRNFQYTDGVPVSGGLNNYTSPQFTLEVQSRIGDNAGVPRGW